MKILLLFLTLLTNGQPKLVAQLTDSVEQCNTLGQALAKAAEEDDNVRFIISGHCIPVPAQEVKK